MNNEETDTMSLEDISRTLETYPHFNRAALAQLVEDTGPQVVLRILARFYIGLEEALSQVESGIHNDNTDLIWKACHKLTGSAELIGFQDFGEKSRRLNLAIKALPDVQAHSEDLHNFISEGRKILQHIEISFPNRQSYL